MKSDRRPPRRCLLATAVGLLCALTGLAAEAARVQWYVDVHTDPIGKRPIMEARVLTQEGVGFKLMRRNDNSLWGEFTLPRSSEAMLTPDRLPSYPPADNDPSAPEGPQKLGGGSEERKSLGEGTGGGRQGGDGGAR